MASDPVHGSGADDLRGAAELGSDLVEGLGLRVPGGDEVGEQLLGGVRRRRQVVGREHGESGRLAQALVDELVGVQRRAQEAVLARLPLHHASLVRRYGSIPMLALEIEATGLLALEAMTDVIAGVKPDRAIKPQ